MRVLVTGGAGFIGRNIVDQLAGRGDEVFVVDNLSRHGLASNPESRTHPNVTLVELDLTDQYALKSLPSPVDRVYHLAGIVGVGPVSSRPAHVLRVNTLVTMNVCDWFVSHCPPGARLLFASTSEVYGGALLAGFGLPVPTPEGVPFVIADSGLPRASYAMSKMWGEMYCRFIGEANGRAARSVRYHNVYGPGMGYEHVIPQVIRRIVSRAEPFRIHGENETRAFCWIGDAVEATIRVMEAADPSASSVVHIGGLEEVTVGEVYEKLFRLCAWRPRHLVRGDSAPGSVPRRCPDVTRLCQLTGYTPSTPLDEGLVPTTRWYLEHPE